jgi:hypothetical protein
VDENKDALVAELAVFVGLGVSVAERLERRATSMRIGVASASLYSSSKRRPT